MIGIISFMNKNHDEEKIESKNKEFVADDFSQEDLNEFWNYQYQIITKEKPNLALMLDHVELVKEDDKIILSFPSKSVRSEFSQIETNFVAMLRKSLNNFLIELEFRIVESDIQEEKIQPSDQMILQEMIKRNQNLTILIKELGLIPKY